jgi:hypothetical protein
MKKLVVLLVIVSLFVPSLAFAGPPPVAFKCVVDGLGVNGLGPNACCVYGCFLTAAFVDAWIHILDICFGSVGGGSLSTSSADGTREAVAIGPNAQCIGGFLSQNLNFFWFCVQTSCFSQTP